MHKIISWYNQNRRRVWIIILAVFIIALIVYRLLQMTSENRNSSYSGGTTTQIDTNALNSVTIQSEKSAISGKKVTMNQEEISTIDNFISYCNSRNVQEAYNLISDECKEEMYPNIKDFNDRYYKPVFGDGKKNVEIENWAGDIYKVEFNEDALSTGGKSSSNIQDYITIVKNGDEFKLNINKYLKREILDKTTSVENIDAKIVRKDSYMDYEYYTFEIKNNNDKAILLGDTNNLKATYLIDENELIYTAPMNELTLDQLIVGAEQTKTIKIKYLNQYSSTRNIKKLTFSIVVLGFDKSLEDFANTTSITFDL